MPSAVVLSHIEVAHELGHLEPWLADNDFAVRRIYREDRPAIPASDLLIVMGSPTSVAMGFCEPAARAEIGAVADWHTAGRPYLGLCFGAQVLAVALDGDVRRQAQAFRGYVELDATPTAPSAVTGPWIVWHNDAITAPPGAEVIGSLDHADLVFRSGRAWGLQPHVEVTPESLERMAIGLRAQPLEYAELVHDLRSDAGGSAARARRLFDAFRDAALGG